MSERCPTCDSPSPLKHPAMQADGGEVQPCPNVWHFSGPLTEEQCANQIRNQLRWHVPSQLPAFDALWAAYERLTAECIALKQIINASEADRGRLRSDLNQAADLVTALVRADNNRTGKGPEGRITGADTLPLQQLLGLALTLREPFGDLGPSPSEGNTSA